MAKNESDRQVNIEVDRLLPGELLSENEKPLIAIKPSLWIIAFLSFRTIVIAAAASAAAIALGPWMDWGRWGGYIILGCGVLVLVRVGFALLQWSSRSYVLTDKRVIRVRGVFTIDIFQCSLERIQNTFLVLTVLQRILGLGHVVFATAGTGGVEAVWQYVKDPLKVHNQLISLINKLPSQKNLPQP
jgi:uncharacterized membrane protein YdbT with pleckstrin-like domain